MSNVLPFRTTRSDGTGRRGLGARPKVENTSRVPKREIVERRRHLEVVDTSGRPVVRGDCAGDVRPCPWVACAHNLYLDVTDSGGIKFNFPDVEPEDVEPLKSCALDVAEQGGSTLEDVASTMNISRERIRQIEAMALEKMRRHSQRKGSSSAILREYSRAPAGAISPPVHPGKGSAPAERPELEAVDVDLPPDPDPVRVSFFTRPDDEDVGDHVSRSVWAMFARWQNGRGFDCRSKASIAAAAAYARLRSKLESGAP